VSSFEGVLRIFSAVMALIFAVFFSSSEVPLFSVTYFWIGMAYLFFLILKKYLYFWETGSPFNLFVEVAELVFILYIHNTSASQLALVFYLSFITRISFLYSWKVSLPVTIASAVGNILIDWKIINFAMDRNALFIVMYGIILYAGTYGGALVMAGINEELLRHKQQLMDTLMIKETLIKELDESREQLRISNEELTHLANTDGLTGLYNHKYFHEYLDNMFRYLEEEDDHISLIIMDLDRFKQYNDTYGHLKGDAVLRDLGEIILECIGEDDVAARYGGDEFAIILPGQDEEDAKKLAERIRKALDDYGRRNPGFVKIGVSIGIASNTHGITTKEQLFRQADRNMYRQKSL